MSIDFDSVLNSDFAADAWAAGQLARREEYEEYLRKRGRLQADLADLSPGNVQGAKALAVIAECELGPDDPLAVACHNRWADLVGATRKADPEPSDGPAIRIWTGKTT